MSTATATCPPKDKAEATPRQPLKFEPCPRRAWASAELQAAVEKARNRSAGSKYWFVQVSEGDRYGIAGIIATPKNNSGQYAIRMLAVLNDCAMPTDRAWLAALVEETEDGTFAALPTVQRFVTAQLQQGGRGNG